MNTLRDSLTISSSGRIPHHGRFPPGRSPHDVNLKQGRDPSPYGIVITIMIFITTACRLLKMLRNVHRSRTRLREPNILLAPTTRQRFGDYRTTHSPLQSRPATARDLHFLPMCSLVLRDWATAGSSIYRDPSSIHRDPIPPSPLWSKTCLVASSPVRSWRQISAQLILSLFPWTIYICPMLIDASLTSVRTWR